MKRFITAFLELCFDEKEWEKFIYIFTNRYIEKIYKNPYCTEAVMTDDRKMLRKQICDSIYRICFYLDDWPPRKVYNDEKQYVIAAVSDDEGIHTALFEYIAFLSDQRETKIRFPDDPARKSSIVERCFVSDDELTEDNKYEVFSDIFYEALWVLDN